MYGGLHEGYTKTRIWGGYIVYNGADLALYLLVCG